MTRLEELEKQISAKVARYIFLESSILDIIIELDNENNCKYHKTKLLTGEKVDSTFIKEVLYKNKEEQKEPKRIKRHRIKKIHQTKKYPAKKGPFKISSILLAFVNGPNGAVKFDQSKKKSS